MGAVCTTWHISLTTGPCIRTSFMAFLKDREDLGRFIQLIPVTDAGPGYQTLWCCATPAPQARQTFQGLWETLTSSAKIQ